MVSARVLAALVWIFFGVAARAQGIAFPALTGRVMDEAGLLSAEDRAGLSQSLSGLEAKTGDQLVVVTVKSLLGRPIEDFGYQLGRFWKIGQKDTNSGALLIVAPNEHQVRIEVGYGLEGTLTDAATRVVIESAILPRFKAGDFPGGIKAGTEQIVRLLGADGTVRPGPRAPPVPDDPSIDPAIWLGLGLVALLIFCAVTGGGLCRVLFQVLYMVLLSSGDGRGGRTSGRDSGFSGGGGSFGGGGSSGKW